MVQGFKNTYGLVAEKYRSRPTYPEALFSWLAKQCDSTEMVWDCGSGSGQGSHALAKYFARVIATDASAEQIAQAVKDPCVEFRCVSAEVSGLPSSSMDLITVFMAVHWFNLEAFFSEVYRVAKPGAIVALFGYGEPTVSHPQLDQKLEEISGKIAPYGGPSIQKMRNCYADLRFPFEDELPMPALNMEVQMTKEQLISYTRSRASVIDYIAQHGPKEINDLEDLLEKLPAMIEPLAVRWPLFGRIAKISKPATVGY